MAGDSEKKLAWLIFLRSLSSHAFRNVSTTLRQLHGEINEHSLQRSVS